MQMLLNPMVPKDQWVCSVTQSCLTLCNLTDCSPRGSSVHRIIQARILEWVAISYSGGSSRLRDLICVSCISCIGRRILYHCYQWCYNSPILFCSYKSVSTFVISAFSFSVNYFHESKLEMRLVNWPIG